MTRRRSSSAGEIVGAIAVLLGMVIWAVRFTIRHPRGVLLGLCGYLLFIVGAVSGGSVGAGLVVLAAYLSGIVIWASRRKRRANEAALLDASERLRIRATLQDLLLLSPTEFEEEVADLLRREGYQGVRRIGGARDLAADVLATAPDGHAVVVQCKRYSPHVPVRSPELQKFIGMAYQHYLADEALLVTTSHLTTHAQALAEQYDVVVIDGDRLSQWFQDVPSPLERGRSDDDGEYPPQLVAFVDHESSCEACARAHDAPSSMCRTGRWLWEQVEASVPSEGNALALRLVTSPPPSSAETSRWSRQRAPGLEQRSPPSIPQRTPGPRDEIAIPMDVGGNAAERYRQRFSVLHRRYGTALPNSKLQALQSLFQNETRLEEAGLLKEPGSG